MPWMHWSSVAARRIPEVQKLEIYQSLWGMQLRNPHLPERSDEEAFAMAAEAGFALEFRTADAPSLEAAFRPVHVSRSL